ncbi:MAG: BREX system P-loop protein BrxC, partial [Bacillota bacterium]
DIYNFLTDEEQDIQREIKNTPVDTANIVKRIAEMVFGDIYTTKKFRYGKYDFAVDQMVDGAAVGAVTGGMRLRILTVATDAIEKSDFRLMTGSSGEAVVVMADTPYYEALESAMKIRKYVKQRNVNQLPKSVQDIISEQQGEADRYESSAQDDLRRALENAAFYVDGEHLEIKGGDAKSKIDQALEYLVSHVYDDLNLITRNAESDADIIAILNGTAADGVLPGLEANRDAAAKMEEYLEMQSSKNLPTSMADLQSRYSGIPYGWREIDIAAVAARLIYEQKVTIKYAGNTIQPDNPKLPDLLRKKSEIGKTGISKRQVVSAIKMKEVKGFLREYFDLMDVPDDEDGLIKFIGDQFSVQKAHYEELNSRYAGHAYPGHALVQTAIALMGEILSQQKDNIALIDRVIHKEDELDDNKEALQNVESFFKNQVKVFDAAVQFTADLSNDLDYLAREEEAIQALDRIRLITTVQPGVKYDYNCIPELNGLMDTVKSAHDELLITKREELLEIVRQCMAEIHQTENEDFNVKKLIAAADNFFTQKKERIAALKSLALLDGLIPVMWTYKDDTCERIENILKPTPPLKKLDQVKKTETHEPPKVIMPIHRQAVFPAKRLESEADIDAYVEKVRTQLRQLLKNCDGIQLN